MLLVTDYYERGSLYDYLQITVLDVEAMTRFVILFIMIIIFVMINIMIIIIMINVIIIMINIIIMIMIIASG